jgi:hypothetical protein
MVSYDNENIPWRGLKQVVVFQFVTGSLAGYHFHSGKVLK